MINMRSAAAPTQIATKMTETVSKTNGAIIVDDLPLATNFIRMMICYVGSPENLSWGPAMAPQNQPLWAIFATLGCLFQDKSTLLEALLGVV